jgi:serine/threonine-protein kinase
MIAHARDPAAAPSTLRGDIPADLETVVLRCLAKNPAERYQDAASLSRALGACAAAALWTADRAADWWRSHAAVGQSESGHDAVEVQPVASTQTVGYPC